MLSGIALLDTMLGDGIPAATATRQVGSFRTARMVTTAKERHELMAGAAERRRRRYPVPEDRLPPLVVMTHIGAVVFTAVHGELAEDPQ
jgi:hypothetical protein